MIQYKILQENRKSLTNSKSGSISLRASREQLHDKNVSSVRKDSSVDKEPTILPLTQRSRSMSAGTKPSERSQSRKSRSVFVTIVSIISLPVIYVCFNFLAKLFTRGQCPILICRIRLRYDRQLIK